MNIPFMINKSWKQFNISLTELENWLKNNIDETACLMATSECLYLCFSDSLSDEQIQQINDLWDSIDENHPIATSYKSQAQIEQEEAQRKEQRQNAINAIKQGALTKSWDEMSVLERKVAMNMEVSDEELGLN